MIALIWMLTWLPQVLPAMSELPPPVNLTLTSDHFIHILKWASAPGTPTGVYYRVDFATERGTFYPVAGCERVQHPLVCNLTEAFSKYEEAYFTQVTARLETQTSQPSTCEGFQPIKDTHLDLPLLTVTPCNRSLCVDLQPHMEHLREHYDLLRYELRIQSRDTDRDKFIGNIKPLSRKILTDLVPGRQYCVSVRFSGDLILRNSNYSQPQCAFAPDVYPADALISSVVCSLVMCGVVVLGLLGFTGFICLKRRPLPAVLTSIRHLEEVLVIQLRNPSFSPLSNIRATLPSSGGKRSSQTPSDESDGESETENTAGSKGGGYKLRGGTNLLSASSSSSTSSSAPSPSLSSNPKAVLLPPDFFSPQPEAQISAAVLNPTYMASLSDSLPESVHSPPADTDSSTVERIELKEEEEEEEEGDGSSQAVNLLTLTFGRREEKEEEEEEEEEEEKSHVDISEVESPFATLILPSQTVDTEGVAIETISCSVVEEEEEEEEEDAELCGYMRRPV